MSAYCPVCGSPKAAPDAACRVCLDQEWDEYRLVKEYLRAHPHSNAMQIANATGVDISKITRFIRNGLIEVVHHAPPRHR